MTIKFNTHWRMVDTSYKTSFKYCIYKSGRFEKNNTRLFNNLINNDNPFLKALNLKYDD